MQRNEFPSTPVDPLPEFVAHPASMQEPARLGGRRSRERTNEASNHALENHGAQCRDRRAPGSVAIGPSDVAWFAEILAAGAGCLWLGLIAHLVLNSVVGINCPTCGKPELRRLARSFSRVSYYQCAHAALASSVASSLTTGRTRRG